MKVRIALPWVQTPELLANSLFILEYWQDFQTTWLNTYSSWVSCGSLWVVYNQLALLFCDNTDGVTIV